MNQPCRNPELNFLICIKDICRHHPQGGICGRHPDFGTLGFWKTSSLAIKADACRETGIIEQRFGFLAWYLLLSSVRIADDNWNAARHILRNPVFVSYALDGVGSLDLSRSVHSKPFVAIWCK